MALVVQWFYCFVFVLDLCRMMERLSEGGALNVGTQSYKLYGIYPMANTHAYAVYSNIYSASDVNQYLY